MNESIISYLWENVVKTTTCWNWVGFQDKWGSPIFQRKENGKIVEYRPRRIIYELSGRKLTPMKKLFPTCKNKLCVNPDHLISEDEERFWSKVQKLSEPDCWVWIGGHDKDMYGKFKVGGKTVRAHVYSWELHNKISVPSILQVCHTCDHPYCIKPDHLFLGTTLENNQDCQQKNRNAKGEKSGSAKLTEKQVKELRELYATGNYSYRKLSQKYVVSENAIGAIIRKQTWRHVL